MKSTKAREFGYWVATIAAALLFAVPGAALLAKVPHFSNEMARLGYPTYFLSMFGALKMIGAAVVLAPRLLRLKEWAYAGMMFDVIFAAFSRAAIGDGVFATIVPLVIGSVVLLSWALRPEDRKLPELLPI
jgi:uncharacterized membrane protein YphA (DoxX/SURF4 family)